MTVTAGITEQTGTAVAAAANPLALRAQARAETQPMVSLVVPVLNEHEAIAPFIDVVLPLFTGRGIGCELVFVNDGSTDETLSVLIAHSRAHANIVAVNLSRNFGKEAAMSAGLGYATGDVVVVMDIDLQDPPEVIFDFIDRWRAGYDVVYGVRATRRSDSYVKKTSAGGFYRLFNAISDISIPENAGDFRLMDRRVVDALLKLPERNRFMKGLFAWVGFSTTAVPYHRPARAFGKTKFNATRLWNFALDGFVSFSSAPLKIWTYLGSMVALGALAYTAYIVVKTLVLGIDVPGYASLMSVILLLSSVQIISIGILGEYIGRLFIETKQRPVFLVDGVVRGGQLSLDDGGLTGPGAPAGVE